MQATEARGEGGEREVRIRVGEATLEGNLTLPDGATGIVLFAHGSGSSRFSPRNRYVASVLVQGGLGTLLMDLLTPQEAERDPRPRQPRFDIGLLAARLVGALAWLTPGADTQGRGVGLFGASTGAAAALIAAARQPHVVGAVVSRGGRPDLAGDALPHVQAPTLLIVGGADTPVIALNETALAQLPSEKRLTIIPGATHLFEEPGTLEEVARLARDWCLRYLDRV